MIGKMVASAIVAVNAFAVAASANEPPTRDQCLLGVAQWTFDADLVERVDRTEDGAAVIVINHDLLDQLDLDARVYVEQCVSMLEQVPQPEDWPLMPPGEEI